MNDVPQPVLVDDAVRARLGAGEQADPHAVLGAHPDPTGVVVRAFHPDAARAELLLDGEAEAARPMAALGGGLFGALVPGASLPLRYRLRFASADGAAWERGDPYRHLPTVGEVDQHLFGEGNHRRLWEILGASPRTVDGEEGVAFAVWAPNARRVSVVGDFCGWDGRLFPLRSLGASGLWELFVPGLGPGELYKYEVKAGDGRVLLKADPYARATELPPGSASRVERSSYAWGDDAWMAARAAGRDVHREPMAIYEVHLASWARVPEEQHRSLTYREVAPRLVEHMRRYGFTHLELLPVAEHPFGGSWGYQVSAYYAPTARFGTPDDFRYLVDVCHQAGIGVIVDWVPAHFPKDEFALARFDGTALFEHADPRQGDHPDWGTHVFNYGRSEVRNFLVANALYWLKELHVDALRVDAVASMLYLDYSREEGEWIPNQFGGRENLDAIHFLRSLNEVIGQECPGCYTIAEESTAWPGVSRPTSDGGLGFAFKWNMGWMHDTLDYFARDPIHRRHHQDQLTFAMIYEFTEHFIMPLSHDEVVHGKGPLLEKMPGDPWQKLANLRLLFTYMYTRPGKKLLFMGSELASSAEWDHDASLDWHLLYDPQRSGVGRLLEALGRLYLERPCLWAADPDPEGFAWIDCSDADNSVMSYTRRLGDEVLVVVLNLTPVPRPDYRVGLPRGGRWREALSSDDPDFGGSEVETRAEVEAEATPYQHQPFSAPLSLPPLGAVVLEPAG